MSKKMDKEMLKSPDMFISMSDKVFNFVEEHFKTFVALAVAVIVVAVGYVTVGYVRSAREQKAAEALYAPEAALKKAESEVREQRAKKTQELAAGKTGKKESQAENLRPVDFAKDYAPSVEKIKTVLKAHGDTKAALVSALNLSYFLSQQKQFKEALEVLDIPGYRPGTSGLLGGFYLMHRGVMQIENGEVDQAIQTYQTVLGASALNIFHPEAMLKLGVAYELKGDAAKAMDSYEKVARQFPDTEASSTAQQYMRLLELNGAKKG